jgi:hypothetical protein
METMPSAKFANNIVSSTCCSLQADIKARLAARLTEWLNALMTLGHSILNSHHSWSLALLAFSLYRCKTQQRLESPTMRLLEERGKSCRQLQCIHVDIWPNFSATNFRSFLLTSVNYTRHIALDMCKLQCISYGSSQWRTAHVGTSSGATFC